MSRPSQLHQVKLKTKEPTENRPALSSIAPHDFLALDACFRPLFISLVRWKPDAEWSLAAMK